MKKILFVLMAVVLFVACGSKSTITFNCDIPGFQGQTAYLHVLGDGDSLMRSFHLTDSAVLTDGKAVFSVKVDQPRFAYIVMGGNPVSSLFVEEGEVVCDANNNASHGTPLNDKLSAVVDRVNALRESIQTDSVPDMRQVILDGMNIYLEVFKSNADNALGELMLQSYLGMGFQAQVLTLEDIDAALELAPERVRQYQDVVEMRNMLAEMERTSEGNDLVDIEGIDPATHQSVKLSDLVAGKVAVVDVWASWCGPCREEISNYLLAIWRKYSSRGVAVVGVSVDESADNCAKMVSQLGITYPVMMDTAKVCGTTYGIQSIPHIMLVDAQGKIVKRGLRGDDIEKELLKLIAQ
ncbi:MAG: AhpC/TSA family protein [Bacteroidales bacterium]|nr:AhpC/TSA family protein [Candidatus Colimorpha onthohippi]